VSDVASVVRFLGAACGASIRRDEPILLPGTREVLLQKNKREAPDWRGIFQPILWQRLRPVDTGRLQHDWIRQAVFPVLGAAD